MGVDNLNDYYDPGLKSARLDLLRRHPAFRFVKADLADREAMQDVFRNAGFQRVVHLAAQAGVRYSIINPHAYVQSNVTGFLHVLEGCRGHAIEHLVYASTSSVYGANTRMPFSERQNVDHPLTLYAATKKSNELMAHSYSSLYRLPTTDCGFFTVYGPWGRPGHGAVSIHQEHPRRTPIDVFNGGNHRRDFTYIDDIVQGVVAAVDQVASADPAFDSDAPNPASSSAPYRIYNIGNQRPVELLRYIEVLEKCLGPAGADEFPAYATRRSARYVGRRRIPGARRRIPAEHGLGNGCEAVRRMVSWLLSSAIADRMP